MDRKNFLKRALLGLFGIAGGKSTLQAATTVGRQSTYDRLKVATRSMERQVGFNHLPNKEVRSMRTVLHKAHTRGHANHGWLDTHHTFSFANYYNPERMNFGVLRVLNDDIVASGRGFGTHPHDNMEIISIPLEGDLEHKDSMGNTAVIKQGDVQVMSAGTGIFHSEYNKNSDRAVKFLQIWLFPNKKNVPPRYDQITLDNRQIRNQLYQIISPDPGDEGAWIHQNAWFHIGQLDRGFSTEYQLKDPRNGVYAFVLEGRVQIEGQDLENRDGFGLWDTNTIQIKANSDTRLLLIEVPMELN